MLKRKIDHSIQYKVMKNNSNTLTVVQHRIHAKAANCITNYLSKHSKNLATRQVSLLIQGHPGSGKTFLIRNLVKQLGLRLLEINISQSRDGKNMNKVLKDAIKNFTVVNGETCPTVIFIDDIDIVLESDIGFIKSLNAIVNESKCPMILACTCMPKDLKSKKITVVQLEKSISYLDLLNTYRDNYCKKVTNIEMLYFFRYYNANLNSIFTILKLPVKPN